MCTIAQRPEASDLLEVKLQACELSNEASRRTSAKAMFLTTEPFLFSDSRFYKTDICMCYFTADSKNCFPQY